MTNCALLECLLGSQGAQNTAAVLINPLIVPQKRLIFPCLTKPTTLVIDGAWVEEAKTTEVEHVFGILWSSNGLLETTPGSNNLNNVIIIKKETC